MVSIEEIYEEIKLHPGYSDALSSNHPLIKFYDANHYEEAKKFVVKFKDCINRWNDIWVAWWNIDKPELLDWLMKAGCDVTLHSANLHEFIKCKNVNSFKVLDKYFHQLVIEKFIKQCWIFQIEEIDILEYMIDKYKEEFKNLSNVANSSAIPCNNLNVFKFWLNILGSGDSSLWYMILCGVLKRPYQFHSIIPVAQYSNKNQHNRLDINTDLKIPLDLILDNINIDVINWVHPEDIQIELINRSYNITDDDYKSITSEKVLEYLYDRKCDLDKLKLNKLFVEKFIDIFKNIMDGKTSSDGVITFPENKYKFVNLSASVCYAVLKYKHEYLKELIKIGADVNKWVINNKSSLMLAIENKDQISIKILLGAGADRNSLIDGKNPLWYINQLSGQVQKQIMDLVFGEQIDIDLLKKENTKLKTEIEKLKTRLENKETHIDELVAKNKTLEQIIENLRHMHLSEVTRSSVLSSMK